MYDDHQFAAVESRGAESRHGPFDRRLKVHSDTAEPRFAVERSNPLSRDYEPLTNEPRASARADDRTGWESTQLKGKKARPCR